MYITVKRWAYIKQAPIKGTVAWDDFLLNPSRPGWKKDLNIFDLGQKSTKIAKIVLKSILLKRSEHIFVKDTPKNLKL